jgi:hypothetical protein
MKERLQDCESVSLQVRRSGKMAKCWTYYESVSLHG